jgi:hypothetical protein
MAQRRNQISVKRTSPFKSGGGGSVQSNTGSRDVRISGSNVGYTMLRGSVKSTGYPFHSPVSPSLPLPFVTVCHHISTGIYYCVVVGILTVLAETNCCALPYVKSQNLDRIWINNYTSFSNYLKHLENVPEDRNIWIRYRRISWTDHVRNENVLLRVKEKRNIIHEIHKRKANWIGHILRRNCLLQRVIEGKKQGGIEVTGRQGRRRTKLLDDLKERR